MIHLASVITLHDVLLQFRTLAPSGLTADSRGIPIASVCDVEDAQPGSLSFAQPGRHVGDALGAVIFGPEGLEAIGNHHVVSKNPRLDFIRVVSWLCDIGAFQVPRASHIHPSVAIHPSAIIETGVTVGERSRIGPGVVLRSGVHIGEECILESNVVIGDKGFGFERDESGRPIEFPHLGGVTVGDRVSLGTGTVVAAGTLRPTRIENDVKTDNLVHIAHNCRIREGVMIAAAAEVSGSVEIGPRAWIGPNSSIMNGITIGAGSLVGLGAVVVREVAPDSVVAGNPARKMPPRD